MGREIDTRQGRRFGETHILRDGCDEICVDYYLRGKTSFGQGHHAVAQADSVDVAAYRIHSAGAFETKSRSCHPAFHGFRRKHPQSPQNITKVQTRARHADADLLGVGFRHGHFG